MRSSTLLRSSFTAMLGCVLLCVSAPEPLRRSSRIAACLYEAQHNIEPAKGMSDDEKALQEMEDVWNEEAGKCFRKVFIDARSCSDPASRPDKKPAAETPKPAPRKGSNRCHPSEMVMLPYNKADIVVLQNRIMLMGPVHLIISKKATIIISHNDAWQFLLPSGVIR